MKVDGLRRIWLRSVTAYTLAGAMASGLVGFCAGGLGSLIPAGNWSRVGLVVAAVIGVLVALRESIGRTWPVPQLRRQTPENLRRRYSAPVAAALWGFDLGLVFSTWLTFAGPWFVLTVAIALGSPLLGTWLFLGQWLARAAWLWLAPYLLTSARIGPLFSQQVVRAIGLFRLVQIIASLIGVAALVRLVVGWT